MAISQARSKRKASSGRYKYAAKKLKHKGSLPAHTKVADVRVKEKRVRGGNEKLTLLSVKKVNVFNPKTKKCTVSEITSVVSNEANRHFVRRSILTKGTVVETKAGKAKITSRPGQEGSLQAVLV